jgi:indolepyruvate ferredoxin oxidoreductase
MRSRGYTDGSFEKQLREQFASWERLEFNLAPPLLARRDNERGI